MATTQRVTIADLAAMEPDNCRYELIRGVLYRMSPAGLGHGIFAVRIGSPLDAHAQAHGLGVVVMGEAGYILAREPDTVLAPDVAFIRADRVPPEEEWDRFAGLAPDLAVEVASPSDRPGEIEEKIAAYVAAGTRLVWVAYPKRRAIAVHRGGRAVVELGRDGVLDGEDVVPGFRLPVSRVFR